MEYAHENTSQPLKLGLIDKIMRLIGKYHSHSLVISALQKEKEKNNKTNEMRRL